MTKKSLFTSKIRTDFGTLVLKSDESKVYGLDIVSDDFEEVDAYDLTGDVEAGEDERLKLACRVKDEILEYFAGKRRTFDFELDMRGTTFQIAVWKALAEIPYGETRSYGEIAEAIGRSGAMRAVGAACGKNPNIILIPCHRVIGKNGALTGFSSGLALKKSLLELEGVL